MAKFKLNNNNEIEIDFDGIEPEEKIKKIIKSSKYQWNSKKKVWCGDNNYKNIEILTKISGRKDYACKYKIGSIKSASKPKLETCVNLLKAHVNMVMTEDNHDKNSVSPSQINAWKNCFEFLKQSFSDPKSSNILEKIKKFILIFEYSIPGTVHERPDVLLLTNKKVISLEFKNKTEPQIDDNQNDVVQAIRYKEWLENHHKVTRDKKMTVKSYLVCTCNDAKGGTLRGIEILTKDNFLSTLDKELANEEPCSFINTWLTSPKTEMPDMLQAIETMYKENKIPYISDVNKNCLDQVLGYINEVKSSNKTYSLTKKILILIDGVPGAGKTAVGQSIVYEENQNGEANAVYLSENGPLVEVLQYQINQIGKNKYMGENAIQGMKNFKSTYFYSRKIPQQSILVFDEAQRAWDKEKMKSDFNEPEGLFKVAERIYKTKGYAVIIGLYGKGQVIYTGEEKGIALWHEALNNHSKNEDTSKNWTVILSDKLDKQLKEVEKSTNDDLKYEKIVDDSLSLSTSLRADFIDCSNWVETAITNEKGNFEKAKKELEKLNKTSMRISITRNFEKIKTRKAEIDKEHPEWKYGILISNFAEQKIINSAFPTWNIGYRGKNVVSNNEYGPWFNSECRKLNKACTVYGNQGLELDCPIVLFGGAYIRKNGQWISKGDKFEKQRYNFENPNMIVKNNFRVLLTRARKEMILFIPDIGELDETYNYFVDMGMEVLDSPSQANTK